MSYQNAYSDPFTKVTPVRVSRLAAIGAAIAELSYSDMMRLAGHFEETAFSTRESTAQGLADIASDLLRS
jgi:hypothetical protein